MSYVPYIGKDTEDFKSKINKEVRMVTLDELNEKITDWGYSNKVNTVNKLVTACVELGLFYTYSKYNQVFITYANDIAYNYRDKVIFIPFTTYLDDIEFPIRKETYEKTILRKRKEDFTNIREEDTGKYYANPKYLFETYNQFLAEEPVITFTNITTGEHYGIDTSSIPLTDEVFISIDKCHQYYLNLHKVHKPDFSRYIEVVSNVNKYERILRSKGELPKYGAYKTINYGDIRYYKHDEVKEYVEDVTDIPYKTRLLLLEMALYTLCNTDGVTVEEKYKADFEKLGKTAPYMKIGKVYPLILKWYYKDQSAFKPKSYDYFESLETLKQIAD